MPAKKEYKQGLLFDPRVAEIYRTPPEDTSPFNSNPDLTNKEKRESRRKMTDSQRYYLHRQVRRFAEVKVDRSTQLGVIYINKDMVEYCRNNEYVKKLLKIGYSLQLKNTPEDLG